MKVHVFPVVGHVGHMHCQVQHDLIQRGHRPADMISHYRDFYGWVILKGLSD
jgi:hypothetical protein